MLKKVLQCFLAISVSGLLLSGCAESGTNNDTSSSVKTEQEDKTTGKGDVTLSIWAGKEEQDR